jgi:hypothetical protein
VPAAMDGILDVHGDKQAVFDNQKSVFHIKFLCALKENIGGSAAEASPAPHPPMPRAPHNVTSGYER